MTRPSRPHYFYNDGSGAPPDALPPDPAEQLARAIIRALPAESFLMRRPDVEAAIRVGVRAALTEREAP